jgi:hypothetical protein
MRLYHRFRWVFGLTALGFEYEVYKVLLQSHAEPETLVLKVQTLKIMAAAEFQERCQTLHAEWFSAIPSSCSISWMEKKSNRTHISHCVPHTEHTYWQNFLQIS